MVASFLNNLLSTIVFLFLPFKDEQAIDISIVLLALATDTDNHADIRNWLWGILNRARFAYQIHGNYPCALYRYNDLLSHPQADDLYRSNVTQGSILYPVIALWSAVLGDKELFERVALFKKEDLKHCNFQVWFPDETSENNLYNNAEIHGETLSDIIIDKTETELLAQVFGECNQTSFFQELSANQLGFWPLILIACRHYRTPVPIHFLSMLDNKLEEKLAL